MCMAIPARVVERRSGERALVDIAGNLREVNVHRIPEIEVGEYVLLYLGFAVERLSEEEAQETLDLWRELATASEAAVEYKGMEA